ncbi:hypothetical protein [Limnohabitans sp. TEGF004]|jgi:hypothetical protein|uniref:hypothetical protein n=1 Tax=Limnohabitans sp. TEGF004 TaxID=2986281 RepID=UPI002376E68F|nr:hypothetical protein [Limnohabitans sp. TEGF004]BDU57000.1 hypothetical protein LTEGF4_26810 [Limnohabitans sp. TEGF004]
MTPLTDSDVNIVEAGKRDYFLRKGNYANPYVHGTSQFNDYERGWMKSLKYDGARLVNAISEQPKTALVKINQYAQLKGREKPRA